MISFQHNFGELSGQQEANAHSQAEDDVLADMDSYTEWLSAQCARSTIAHCRIGYVPRDPVRFAAFVESLDVPQLVALSLYPATETAGYAMRELRGRYLKDASTVKYIRRLWDDNANAMEVDL